MTRGDQFDVIGFDADDTLWRSEDFFQSAEDCSPRLVAPYAPDGVDVLDALHAIEHRQHPDLRLRREGVRVVDGAGRRDGDGRTHAGVGDRGAGRPCPRDAACTRSNCCTGCPRRSPPSARSHRLVLITKGDLVHQTRKVRTSGLEHHFEHIEVVLDKNVATYRRVLAEWDIDPATLPDGRQLGAIRHPADRRARRSRRPRALPRHVGPRGRARPRWRVRRARLDRRAPRLAR